jgi:hypothetical protein
MSEEIKAKMKACFPEGLEAIMISKDDYDRLCGDLTYRNVELQQENQQLKNDNAVMKANLIQIRDERLERYKSVLDEIRELINNHNRNAGKLYYRYNNKYLLSEIKEDILQILDKVKE